MTELSEALNSEIYEDSAVKSPVEVYAIISTIEASATKHSAEPFGVKPRLEVYAVKYPVDTPIREAQRTRVDLEAPKLPLQSTFNLDLEEAILPL